MEPDRLEGFIERKLRELPPLRAPETLLPRVLAAVGRTVRRPRTWFTWPLTAQVGSLVAAVLVVAAIFQLWPVLESTGLATADRLSGGLPERAQSGIRFADALAGVARTCWALVVEPLVRYIAIVVLLMAAGFAAFVAMLDRVISE